MATVVRTRVFVAAFFLVASVSGAVAAKLSIKGNASEAVEASDNEFMTKSPSGATVKSTTNATLDFLAQTLTTNYFLHTNGSYYKYFGPGAADTQLTWGTPANALFKVDHTTKLTRYNFGASWSRSDVSQTQLAETGFSTGRGSSDTYNAFGSISRDLSRLDSITWSANASTVSFTDPTQTPYVDLSSTLAWYRTLSRTTSLTNSVYFDSYSQDDAAKTQRLFWQFKSGLKSELTPRLTFNGNVYLVFANTYQTNGVAQVIQPSPTNTTAFQPQVGAGHAVFGDVGLSYRATKSTTISLNAGQMISPTITGALQQSKSIGLSVNYAVNEFSNLSFFTKLSQSQTPAQIGASGTASDFLSAELSYSYRLTRDWRANMSYTFRQRNDDSGTVRSNTVLLTLSRDFNLLGNPSAINEAEAERARERAQQAVGEVFPRYR